MAKLPAQPKFDEPLRMDKSFSIPLDDWHALLVFGLALDSNGAGASRFTWQLPEAVGKGIEIPACEGMYRANRLKVTTTLDAIQIERPKVGLISASFLKRNFGPKFTALLNRPPDGTVLTVAFIKSGFATQVYRGAITKNAARIPSTVEFVTTDCMSSRLLAGATTSPASSAAWNLSRCAKNPSFGSALKTFW